MTEWVLYGYLGGGAVAIWLLTFKAMKYLNERPKNKQKNKIVKVIPVKKDEYTIYNYLTHNKSLLLRVFNFKFIKNWWMEKKNPESTVLISMELLNGFHKVFLVKEKNDGFKYRGNKYLFDNEMKYYILGNKIWCYDFHEKFSLPVKRKIPVTSIKKTLEASQISEVEYATNPATLERFEVSKIAEGIMKGHAIDEFFKQIRLIMIIVGIVTVIHFLLFVQASGMLDNLQLPGTG